MLSSVHFNTAYTAVEYTMLEINFPTEYIHVLYAIIILNRYEFDACFQIPVDKHIHANAIKHMYCIHGMP